MKDITILHHHRTVYVNYSEMRESLSRDDMRRKRKLEIKNKRPVMI